MMKIFSVGSAIFIFLSTCIFSFQPNGFACDLIMRDYQFECNIQDRYRYLKKSFYKNWKINIEDIYYYKVSRLVEGKALEQALIEEKKPWEIYTPSPETWELWEDGLKFIEKTPRQLSLDYLKELHKTTINEKLIGFFSYTVSFLIPLENTILLGPGNLRRSSLNFRPYFSFSCEEKIDKSLIELLTKKDLKGKGGEALLEISTFPCLDERYFSGIVYYTDSIRVEDELNYLIEMYNKHIKNMYFKKMKRRKINRELENSPYYFINKIQRHYVAIHPFREGNGRLSRFLQDMYCKKFKLPYVPGGLLQNDILRNKWDYLQDTHKALNQSMDILEKCLNEYKKYQGNQEEILFQCRHIRSFEK